MPTMSHVSDQELMKRAQADDTVAFGRLYDRLAPRAFGIALRVLNGDRERAHDATQEGFLSLWRSRAYYRPGRGPVQAWAFGIVRNRAIDTLRRNGRHDEHRSNSEHSLEFLAAPGDLEASVIGATDSGALRPLLAQLPEEQREVIVLAYYGELSHTEIARHLTLPVGTVKGRMRLGLIRMREILA